MSRNAPRIHATTILGVIKDGRVALGGVTLADRASPELLMLVLVGGRSRTLTEFRQLAGSAGLAVAAPFMRRSWYRPRVVIPASIAIAATGLYWTLVRALAGTNF